MYEWVLSRLEVVRRSENGGGPSGSNSWTWHSIGPYQQQKQRCDQKPVTKNIRTLPSTSPPLVSFSCSFSQFLQKNSVQILHIRLKDWPDGQMTNEWSAPRNERTQLPPSQKCEAPELVLGLHKTCWAIKNSSPFAKQMSMQSR